MISSLPSPSKSLAYVSSLDIPAANHVPTRYLLSTTALLSLTPSVFIPSAWITVGAKLQSYLSSSYFAIDSSLLPPSPHDLLLHLEPLTTSICSRWRASYRHLNFGEHWLEQRTRQRLNLPRSARFYFPSSAYSPAGFLGPIRTIHENDAGVAAPPLSETRWTYERS